jgi:hypothetical protein
MLLKQWYKRRSDYDSGALDLAPDREEKEYCYTASAPKHPVICTVVRKPKKLIYPD